MKLLPRDVQTRRKEEEEEVAQLKTPNKWVQWKAWKERKKMVKSKLQSKLKKAVMQGGEDGEKRLSKALDVETHENCKMNESEG